MPMTVHCPKCGCDVIKERNVAYANLEVLEWEWDEEEGAVRPTDYDTDESADWEACDGPNVYACANCDWEGDTDALAVRGGLCKTAPCPEGCAGGSPADSCAKCHGTGVITVEG